MNLENVNKAIAVMERVKARGDKFDLTTWQDAFGANQVVTNEEELHTCRTAACFAGWVAVSPEFQADGGRVEKDGSPLWVAGGWPHHCSGPSAIREWLEISGESAADLCGCGDTERVYGVESEGEVTVDEVLDALYRLRDTGTPYLK